jgi:tyrosyl-tRNA synthetase
VNESDLPPNLFRAHQVLAAGTAAILPADGLADKLLLAASQNRPLRVKLGIDPSGADLTLGHAVPLRKLRQFQDFGHTAVLVVGGFTGQVGDPSGKTSTRLAQSASDVIAHAKGYFDQIMRILDADRTEVVNNATWLGSMSLAEILGYSRQITVAQLLERDDFAKRFASHSPISLSEFFYPMLQGIDSVEISADIELGGTDQTFNNLIGRELQRGAGQRPQTVITVPLLVGTDGTEKMGKSLSNYVALTDSAAQQFGQLMSIPDHAVTTYAELAAAMPPEQVTALSIDVANGGPAANLAKRAMARQVVSLYHGDRAAAEAEAGFDAVFKQNLIQTDSPKFALTGALLARDGVVHLPALLTAAGLANSSSEARRQQDAGAVRLDGQVLAAKAYDVPAAELIGKVLAIGKRKAIEITAAPDEHGNSL